MTRTAFAVTFLLCASPAMAGIKDFLGAWHLSLHGQRCNIRFVEKRVAGGYGLVQKCLDAFGVQSAIAWKAYDGGIVFLSETGVPVMTFEATEELYLSANNPELALRK